MTEKRSTADMMAEIAKHTQLYLTDPAKAHYWDTTFGGGKGPTPTLLLTYTGRKSGKRLSLPLIYGKDGDRFVIIASKGGAPEHPKWYLNIQDNPEVEIQAGLDKYKGRARTIEGPERDRIWAYMADLYPPYHAYQKRTDRKIPVVLIEPHK